MLSLVAIIFPAAWRTVICEPAGSVSKPDEPSFLASLVIVRVSSQRSGPGQHGLLDGEEHVGLEDRRQRQ